MLTLPWMMPASPIAKKDLRPAAISLTLLVHMILIYGWHLSTRKPVDNHIDNGRRIQWLLLPKPAPVAAPTAPVSKQVVMAPEPALPAAPALPREEKSSAPATVPLDAESAPANEMSMMDRARSAVAGIDRSLQEENKRKLIRAKPVSTQMRLERAMQQAHDMAPNKWYEAPKVTEIIDPGGYDRRRYRVVGADRTYCITIESNHAPDGIDTMQHGIKPKLTNCPPDEQAATKQDW